MLATLIVEAAPDTNGHGAADVGRVSRLVGAAILQANRRTRIEVQCEAIREHVRFNFGMDRASETERGTDVTELEGVSLERSQLSGAGAVPVVVVARGFKYVHGIVFNATGGKARVIDHPCRDRAEPPDTTLGVVR